MTDPRPWGPPTEPHDVAPRPGEGAEAIAPPEWRPSEPLFNSGPARAWGLWLIVVLIGVGFAAQTWLPGLLHEPNLIALGALSRGTIGEGWWWTPLTSMFMHGDLLHLGMNLSALIPFGLILARRFGPDLRGQLRFLAYYLVAGLAGGAAYLALQPETWALAVGASGAIFGLWGGVLRLTRDGQVLPPFSPLVLKQFGGPIIANIVVIVAFGLTGGGIAWQAHLGGFLLGWLALGVFLPRREP